MSFELVVVGASWGALQAFGRILPGLSADLPAAVVIVQHRSPDSPASALVETLNRTSALPVREAEDKVPIEPGTVYVAPADYHLLIEPGHFALSTEGEVDFARPSIDVSFESAADSYGEGLVACVLTGANEDGSKGIVHVKRNGGYVIAQEPEGSERAAMPRASIATGLVDRVVSLDEVARVINELVGASVEEAR